MTPTRDLKESLAQGIRWPLVLALGAFALVRPVLSITGAMDGLRPAGPLIATAVVTLVWIGAVVLAGSSRPVLTLVWAGVTYAVLAIALSGILSPILEGELEGPLANPVAIVPVLAVNAVWGLLSGLVAAAVQGARGRGTG